jgi:hypothetical protein
MHSILVVILSACVVQAHANEAPAVDHDELTEEDMDNLVEMLNDDKIADMVVQKLVDKLLDFSLLAASPKIALAPPVVQSRPHFAQQAFHPALGVGTASAIDFPSVKLPEPKIQEKAFETPKKLKLEENPGAGQISMKNYNSITEEKRWNVGSRADTQTDIENLYGDPAKLALNERPDGYADISKRSPPKESFYNPGNKEALFGNSEYEKLGKNGLNDPIVKEATDQSPEALKERTGGRPLLSSQNDVLSLSAVLLISVVVGSGVVLAALRFGRSTSNTAFKEPLVGV